MNVVLFECSFEHRMFEWQFRYSNKKIIEKLI